MGKNQVKKKYKISDMTILGIILAITMISLLGLGTRFYSLANFRSMGFQVSEFGFIAIAMSLAMISGGIDLSVVSNAGLSGVIGILFMNGSLVDVSTWSESSKIVVGIILTLIVSTICGLLNGILIAKVSIPPILATLGTMMFFNGIGMTITKGESVGNTVKLYTKIGSSTLFGFPVILILLLVTFAIISLILNRTLFGARLMLVGENKAVSNFSGIDVESTLIKSYMLSGFLVGVSAVIITSRVNSARMGFGDTYQLQAILVAVLGGVDPDGGKGNLWGVAIGIAILQFLQSALTILGGTPYTKKLIWGALLLVVISVNYFNNRERKARV